VTAAGGVVNRGKNGAHRGIAHEIEINQDGLNHPIYKDKDKIFNTPAFNYDEVVTLPKNAILLSSNKVNNVMALNFETEFSKIWGIQYHPEITYEKMITLIKFRRERLLENKSFSDESDLESHISMIEDEDKITKKESRMRELKNWLDLIA
jgi:GMP synthase (glutamine-hydrolysing)